MWYVNIIEEMNETAHGVIYDSWLMADDAEENGEENAEELREEASEEQQEVFRSEYDDLSESDKESIRQWYMRDADFREQFETYYGGEFNE